MYMKNKSHVIWGVIVLLLVLFIIGKKGVPYSNLDNIEDVGFSQEMALSDSSNKFALSLFSGHERSDKTSAPSPAGAAEVEQDSRLIIKTGNLSVVVEDVPETIAELTRFAETNGGFVVRSSVSEHGLAPTGSVVIRVPSGLFDVSIMQAKSMGDVQSESTSGRDVTEEFVDLDAQLSNLRATESQFLEIMKKAYNIQDILSVQRELSQVRSQIERIQGKMKYLKESADLSTITVNLSTDPNLLPVVDDGNTWKPWAVVKNAVRSMIEALQIVFAGLIWLVIYIPVALIYTLGAWIVYRVFLKIKRKFQS